MKAVLTTLGKFHSFDLARQLEPRGALAAIYSGYPRFKLKQEGLPAARVRTFPWVHGAYMAAGWRDRFGVRFLRQWEWWDRLSLDAHVARNLPEADLFVGLSGCGLATGRVAQRRGMRYVCDRGSTHIRHQNDVLATEHDRWGLPFAGVDPRIVEREEAEYAQADAVTVPSNHVRQTFLARGVPAAKVKLLSYGVDLQRFHPVGRPREHGCDLLFVGGASLRKGIPYLLQAYAQIEHPAKTLTIAGIAEAAVVERMRALGLLPASVRFLGHVPQPELKALMSASHALLLPSLEEGLAMVMAQALACGCPVVATPDSGAADLYCDGVEGHIVPPRDADALAERLQTLVDDPGRQAQFSAAAVQRVQAIGGWSTYGAKAMQLYEELCGSTDTAHAGAVAPRAQAGAAA